MFVNLETMKVIVMNVHEVRAYITNFITIYKQLDPYDDPIGYASDFDIARLNDSFLPMWVWSIKPINRDYKYEPSFIAKGNLFYMGLKNYNNTDVFSNDWLKRRVYELTYSFDELPDCKETDHDSITFIKAFNLTTDGFFEKLDELERNCEDAVNRLAYKSYDTYRPGHAKGDYDYSLLDVYMGMARDYVRENGPSHGIEWEEF